MSPADNERLEFLGDAVLELCVSDELYHRFPQMREGEMTRLRASIVNESALCSAAGNLGLGAFLRLGAGERAAGGREKPSILSDAFEAVIAAVYLDGGWDEAKGFICRYVLPLLDFDAHPEMKKDYKTMLQELVHRKAHGAQVVYQLIGEEGPDHMKTFRMAVLLHGEELGRGEGTSKQNAGQAAAREALRKMGETV